MLQRSSLLLSFFNSLFGSSCAGGRLFICLQVLYNSVRGFCSVLVFRLCFYEIHAKNNADYQIRVHKIFLLE